LTNFGNKKDITWHQPPKDSVLNAVNKKYSIRHTPSCADLWGMLMFSRDPLGVFRAQ
jgi:hypothetical protein